MLSPGLRLAFSPADGYAALVRQRSSSRWWQVLQAPAQYVLLIGALTAMSTTGRVTAGLVFTVALSWSFVLAIQALAAAVIIALAPHRTVTVGRAFELLFLGHVPWSLWMLAASFSLIVIKPFMSLTLLLTMAIPGVWTMVILSAFCRRVLGAGTVAAGGFAVLHQAVIWSCFLNYVAFAAGGWARVLQVAGL